jgi:hypothetical protein
MTTAQPEGAAEMARNPVQKTTAQPPGTSVVRDIPISPHFNKVFCTTAGLTLLCLVISLALAALGRDNEASREVLSGCLTMAKIGFGAIVGLIGGKAL